MTEEDQWQLWPLTHLAVVVSVVCVQETTQANCAMPTPTRHSQGSGAMTEEEQLQRALELSMMGGSEEPAQHAQQAQQAAQRDASASDEEDERAVLAALAVGGWGGCVCVVV